MSRETNSLLLRYGLNTFWSASLNKDNLFYWNVLKDNLLKFVLATHSLSILKTQYNFSLITSYVFHFKQERVTFVYKYLKLQKSLLTKLDYRKHYGLQIQTEFIKQRRTNVNLFFILLLLTTRKLYSTFQHLLLTKSVFFYIFKKKKFNINHLTVFFKTSKSTKASFFWNYKLKYLNQIIKLKILGLHCSLVIYLYTLKKVQVNLKSVTERLTCSLRFPYTFKYNPLLLQKLFLILIGFIFLKSSILNNYINVILKKTKNKKHIKNLISFFSSLKIIFNKQVIPLLGLKFKITGRLDGKLRKASYGYKLGSLTLLSLALNLDFSCDTVYTQYGSFSLKLWLGNQTSV